MFAHKKVPAKTLPFRRGLDDLGAFRPKPPVPPQPNKKSDHQKHK
jgi:hypothetical protein